MFSRQSDPVSRKNQRTGLFEDENVLSMSHCMEEFAGLVTAAVFKTVEWC